MTAYTHHLDEDSEPFQRRTPKGLAKSGRYFRGCGKMPYASVGEAYAVAARINQRCHGRYKVRAYRCEVCHRYHLAQKKDRLKKKIGWVRA